MTVEEANALEAGAAAHGRGDLPAAERIYREVLRAHPDSFDALHLLGVAQAQQRRFEEAERLISRALARRPDHPGALSNLGNVLSELGRSEEAIRSLKRALALKPDSAEAAYNLGNALNKAQRHEEAAAVYRELLQRRPDLTPARFNLADALRQLVRHEEALDQMEKVLAADPKDASAHVQLGAILRELDRREGARRAFCTAIDLDPTQTEPLLHLVGMDGIAPGDPLLIRMEELERRSDLPADRRSLLLFALAEAYGRLGRDEESFSKLLEANRLRRGTIAYDEGPVRSRFVRIRRSFTPELLATHARQGAVSELPIFILGYPRSGTTLTEQILASHPAVHAGGELRLMGEIAASVTAGGMTSFPECLARLSGADLRRLGETYVDRLGALAPDAPRITDKMPDNYMFIGFIHLILPRARVIHLRRDPRDTCLSCFTQHFAAELNYTYDLRELGRHHRMYLDLMEHWRRVLPAGAMLEVNYEDLVDDLEREVRRILDYCGLPWDARCLAFHQTSRTVRTASLDQVRRPVYRSSIERWRRFEKHLGPLLEGLARDPLAEHPPGRGPALQASPGMPRPGAAGMPADGPESAAGRDLRQRALRAHREGKLATADKLYRRILEQSPQDAVAMQLLGVVRAQQRRFAEAEPLLARAASLSPANPEIHNNLGNVLLELGRAGEATESFRRAIALRPDYPEAHYNLGNALRRLDQVEQAVAAYRAAIALRPGYRDALFNFADLFRQSPDPLPAIDLLRQLLAHHPRDAEAHGLMGAVLRQTGRLTEAVESFDRALAINPRLAGVHYNRARMKKIEAGDPHFAAMQELARHPQQLGEAERGLLHMALGKACADLGRDEEAFGHFLEGNRVNRRLFGFDEAEMEVRFEGLKRAFTQDIVASGTGGGSPSDVPVFILGFPRSGTTLVEQILASHPEVHGAGELGYLEHVASSFRGPGLAEVGYPDYARRLGPADWRAAGELYVERLRSLAPTATRVTDKVPDNYMHIGFIYLALPRARVIHVVRNPLDTCVSCFGINFFAGLRYTCDLMELGRQYRRYLDLMDHWRRVLPAGFVLDVRYEALVDNIEAEARRIVAHCGLAWDPRCIDFHETARPVRTASVIQVRQPLYRSSLQRWRRYEKHLGPLIEALGPEAAAAAKASPPA